MRTVRLTEEQERQLNYPARKKNASRSQERKMRIRDKIRQKTGSRSGRVRDEKDEE